MSKNALTTPVLMSRVFGSETNPKTGCRSQEAQIRKTRLEGTPCPDGRTSGGGWREKTDPNQGKLSRGHDRQRKKTKMKAFFQSEKGPSI